MLGKCFAAVCLISIVSAIATGNVAELASAAVAGAGEAVTLIIGLIGMMTFWSGILSVLRDCGAIDFLSRLIAPVMRLAFPNAWKTGAAKCEITAACAANILGIGSAATPLAISAVARMQEENPDKSSATPDMITLAVLGSCSFNLFPSTVISMLIQGGGTRAFDITVPVWICSAACAVLGVFLSRLASALTVRVGARGERIKAAKMSLSGEGYR